MSYRAGDWGWGRVSSFQERKRGRCALSRSKGKMLFSLLLFIGVLLYCSGGICFSVLFALICFDMGEGNHVVRALTCRFIARQELATRKPLRQRSCVDVSSPCRSWAIVVTQVLAIGETETVGCVALLLLTSPLASPFSRSTKLSLPFLVDVQLADAVKGPSLLVEWTTQC
jgi:hypothetical protein